MEEARQKVQIPAIMLMVIAGLAILGACVGSVMSIVALMANTAAVAVADQQNGNAAMAFYAGTGGAIIRLIWAVVIIPCSAFVLFGAMKMKDLKSYNMAMAATIVAMTPFIGACCCLGLPVGIWSLMVLMDQNVKSAFRG